MKRAILLVGAALVHGCAPSDATAALFCDNNGCARFALTEGEGGGGGGGASSNSSSGGAGEGGVVGMPSRCTSSEDCDGDDGNPCNGTIVCGSDRRCRVGPVRIPDDENACTADSCDGDQPRHETMLINDGDPCTLDECDPTIGIRHTPIPGCQS